MKAKNSGYATRHGQKIVSAASEPFGHLRVQTRLGIEVDARPCSRKGWGEEDSRVSCDSPPQHDLTWGQRTLASAVSLPSEPSPEPVNWDENEDGVCDLSNYGLSDSELTTLVEAALPEVVDKAPANGVVLRVSHNQVTEFMHLSALHLGGFESIRAGPAAAAFGSVTSLDMSHNRFQNLAGFDAMPLLKCLNASHNDLESTEDVGRNFGLEVLNFAHNPRISVIQSLERLKSLQSLDLSCTAVRGLEDIRALSLNSKLHTLSLENTPLSKIAGKFSARMRNLLPQVRSLAILDTTSSCVGERTIRPGYAKKFEASRYIASPTRTKVQARDKQHMERPNSADDARSTYTAVHHGSPQARTRQADGVDKDSWRQDQLKRHREHRMRNVLWRRPPNPIPRGWMELHVHGQGMRDMATPSVKAEISQGDTGEPFATGTRPESSGGLGPAISAAESVSTTGLNSAGKGAAGFRTPQTSHMRTPLATTARLHSTKFHIAPPSVSSARSQRTQNSRRGQRRGSLIPGGSVANVYSAPQGEKTGGKATGQGAIGGAAPRRGTERAEPPAGGTSLRDPQTKGATPSSNTAPALNTKPVVRHAQTSATPGSAASPVARRKASSSTIEGPRRVKGHGAGTPRTGPPPQDMDGVNLETASVSDISQHSTALPRPPPRRGLQHVLSNRAERAEVAWAKPETEAAHAGAVEAAVFPPRQPQSAHGRQHPRLAPATVLDERGPQSRAQPQGWGGAVEWGRSEPVRELDESSLEMDNASSSQWSAPVNSALEATIQSMIESRKANIARLRQAKDSSRHST